MLVCWRAAPVRRPRGQVRRWESLPESLPPPLETAAATAALWRATDRWLGTPATDAADVPTAYLKNVRPNIQLKDGLHHIELPPFDNVNPESQRITDYQGL